MSHANYSELSVGTVFVGSGVLRQVLMEVRKLAFSAVINTLLVVLGIKPKSRVAADIKTGDLVFSGVKLRNYKVFKRFDILSKFVPYRSEGFAVTAPGRVVFNEHILGWILNNLLPVASDQDSEAVDGIRLRYWLRLQVGC